MAKGIEFLFKKNKVEYVVGKGQVNVPGMVGLSGSESSILTQRSFSKYM